MCMFSLEGLKEIGMLDIVDKLLKSLCKQCRALARQSRNCLYAGQYCGKCQQKLRLLTFIRREEFKYSADF